MSKTVSAVVVCAGSSVRMGGTDKIFSEINGVPVFIRTLAACAACAQICEIVVVAKPESFDRVRTEIERFGISKTCCLTKGGNTRAESVRNGVLSAKGEYVAVMDGARPMIKPQQIERTCRAAFECGAAALGVPVTDTVKRIDDNADIVLTVDRKNLVRIQTPQVFLRAEYLELSAKALETDVEFTDDCAVYEYYGKRVKTVFGTNENIKITVKEDLDICSRLCGAGAVRVGHGYDVHRLMYGRELWLCGEKIDFDMGLDGHSDADVALHALIDALLGAAALGDIGTLFPDSDPKYKGISSMLLLKSAAQKVLDRFSVINCDITIIAQKPRLSGYIPQMRSNISGVLGVLPGTVNVKATTEEKLGFTGSLEGIAAHAVCSLMQK